MAVRPTPTPALLLHHRGIDKGWGLWWLLAWAAAVASSQVTIPRIDPGVSSASSALEQLGAIGLCLPLVLVGVLVPDRTAWLTTTAPRSPVLMGLGNLGLITGVSLISAMTAAALYPNDIRWLRIVSLFALLLALTLITGVLLGGVWAAFLAPVFVILNTIPGLIPWEWNIVYNPATDPILIFAAAISLATAFIVAATSAAIQRSLVQRPDREGAR